MKITIKDGRGQDARSITVDYPIGETLQENTKTHGEDIVNRLFVAKAKIEAQDAARRMLKAGKSEKDIQNALSEFKLGQRQSTKKSAKDKALDAYQKMTAEEKAEFVKNLKK